MSKNGVRYFFCTCIAQELATKILLPLEIVLFQLEQKPLGPEYLVFFSVARTSRSDGGIFTLKLNNYSNYINFCSDFLAVIKHSLIGLFMQIGN